MQAEQQKAITQQQNPMTPELATELINLFKQPKIQVKYGSLNAILQYTKSQQSKKMFAGTELFVEMNKVINNQQMTKLILSTLINFSSCAELEKQFVRFVEPLVFNLKEWKDDLREELALLVLLNITKFDSVIETLIGEGEKRGFLLQVLYGFMEIKEARRWVITNMYANVTSIEVGRKFVGEQKIYLRFLNYINAQKQAVRLGVLKILRNVSFEWQVEDFVQEILKPEHDVINRLAQHLAYLVIVSNLSAQTSNEDVMKVLKDYQPIEKQSINIINKMKVASKQKALAEVCLVVDIFLILSNANFAERKVSLKHQPMREILSILRFTDLSDEYKDKLEALEIFCFN